MRVATGMIALLLAGLGCATSVDEAGEASPPPAEVDVPDGDAPGDAAGEADADDAGDPPAAGAPDTEQPDEPAPTIDRWRATWVHLFDDTLKSLEGIDAVVEQAAAADLNVIIAQVARRHDAYYEPGHLPRTNDPNLPAELDVLAELLPRAHAAGIQVHAWVGLAPTWHAVYDDIDPPTGWVSVEHGPDAAEADRWITRTIDGDWSTYLDPALPEVRAHLIATITDIAERYPVDGIHLDYVRYDSPRHGYHPRNLAAFAAESGDDDLPAPDDERWSDWRRERTRQVIVDAAAALAPFEVSLSAATIAWGEGPGAAGGFEHTRAYTDTLQDWDGWVHDGLLDAVLPMVYFRAHEPDQASHFDQWIDHLADLTAEVGTVAVVPGVGGWLNTSEAVAEQVAAAAAATGHGAIYSYQQPTSEDVPELWELLVTAW